MRRILIIDGEPEDRSFVARTLAGEGYAADIAPTGAQGLRQALAGHYDLVILDLLLPDMDGRVVLDRLLNGRPEQAVMVSSRVSDVAAKVDCLERGAQDYMTKPFPLPELLARVHVRLRAQTRWRQAGRQGGAGGPGDGASAGGHGGTGAGGGTGVIAGGARGTGGTAGESGTGGTAGENGHGGTGQPGTIIRAGTVSLDVGRLAADAGHGPIRLTRLEFLLLRELASHAGRPVPKERLLAAVWGYDFDPGSNVVGVCVRRLRAKLGFGLIKTVRGEGYRLLG
ncbi:MAG TPA: response regulator transcription factor [Streptosporangiaceae bacterium]|nr:response regulator transcription factor [Streptosporangiaceae bacterium]